MPGTAERAAGSWKVLRVSARWWCLVGLSQVAKWEPKVNDYSGFRSWHHTVVEFSSEELFGTADGPSSVSLFFRFEAGDIPSFRS